MKTAVSGKMTKIRTSANSTRVCPDSSSIFSRLQSFRISTIFNPSEKTGRVTILPVRARRHRTSECYVFGVGIVVDSGVRGTSGV
jgi:hypothetical protein